MFGRPKNVRGPKPRAYKSKIEARRNLSTRFIVVLSILLVLVVTEFFLRDTRFLIKNVNVAGTDRVNAKDLASAASAKLDGNILWLLPRNNKFIFGEEDFAANLIKAHSRIESVELSYPERGTLKIEIAEKEDRHIWCGKWGCFYLDPEGLIFAEAPSFADGVFIKMHGPLYDIGTVLDAHAPYGFRYLRSNEFEDVLFMIEGVYELGKRLSQLQGVGVLSVDVDTDGVVELFTTEDWLLRYNTSQDRELVLRNLIINLESYDVVKQLQAGERLEYIDLRFGNRVYTKYKDRDQNLEEE